MAALAFWSLIGPPPASSWAADATAARIADLTSAHWASRKP